MGLDKVKNIFKSPIVKGIGKALGPILSLATSISNSYSLIQDAKAQKAEGKQVNTGDLGKNIIKSAAYPIANLSTNLIPGVGTAISLTDGILSTVGLSPIKWLTDNLIDLIPSDAFDNLGKLALGDNEKEKNTLPQSQPQPLKIENTSISSSSNKTKETINAKDYIIKTLPEDTVVSAGGTNLGRTEEMVSLLKELITAVKQGGNVYLDATKVGTAMNVGTYKVQ